MKVKIYTAALEEFTFENCEVDFTGNFANVWRNPDETKRSGILLPQQKELVAQFNLTYVNRIEYGEE